MKLLIELKRKITGANLFFALIALAVLVVVVITLGQRRNLSDFLGIAETREFIVNFNKPVGIKRIHVVPGGIISKDDLLVELVRPELEQLIDEISSQLDALRSQGKVDAEGLRSKIAQYESLRKSKISEINYQIRSLEAEYDMNRKLASGLRTIEKDKVDSEQEVKKGNLPSPLLIKIESLKGERDLAVNSIDLNIKIMKDQLASSDKPLNHRVEELRNKLEKLKIERNRLVIRAQISGTIGSINFKDCLLYTSPSPRDVEESRMPSSA